MNQNEGVFLYKAGLDKVAQGLFCEALPLFERSSRLGNGAATFECALANLFGHYGTHWRYNRYELGHNLMRTAAETQRFLPAMAHWVAMTMHLKADYLVEMQSAIEASDDEYAKLWLLWHTPGMYVSQVNMFEMGQRLLQETMTRNFPLTLQTADTHVTTWAADRGMVWAQRILSHPLVARPFEWHRRALLNGTYYRHPLGPSAQDKREWWENAIRSFHWHRASYTPKEPCFLYLKKRVIEHRNHDSSKPDGKLRAQEFYMFGKAAYALSRFYKTPNFWPSSYWFFKQLGVTYALAMDDLAQRIYTWLLCVRATRMFPRDIGIVIAREIWALREEFIEDSKLTEGEGKRAKLA